MGDRRALLTDREREIVAGEADVSDSYRYQTISRVRARFDRLEDDLRALRAHGDLLEELREVVCEDVDEVSIAESGSSPSGGHLPEREPSHGAVTDESAALEALDFPSSVDRDAAIEAVLAARDYLREQGKASMRDFVTDVMPEHSLGYDVPDLEEGERYRGSWWRNVVRPGLAALSDVEAPGQGSREFQYTGETDE